MSFANRVAVITGASSGIGVALARLLVKEGLAVGLIARRRDLLDGLAAELNAAGGRAAVAVADVGDRDAVRAAVAALAAALGPADLLIANAGVAWTAADEPFNFTETEQTIRINLLGAIYTIEAVLPAMLERGGGHVAAVSSLAAYKGLPGESAYCASKAGLNAYLEGLRLHLRPRNIRFTTLCPGFVATPMTATFEYRMPYLLSAEQAARMMLRALRGRRAVYNFPWQTALLVKASRWIPDWLMLRFMHRANIKPPVQVG